MLDNKSVNFINNKRIEYFKPLILPNKLKEQLPLNKELQNLIINTRTHIENILSNQDKRMLFIVGPCSIHNVNEAKIYGTKLVELAKHVKDKILIVMRVYFEKPRTTIGWKGLINDPCLNNTFEVNKGMYMARKLLLDLNTLGMPCGYEILDTITPQYISDLISWGAIGARTSESQIHRQIVSGLSMPVGFKNGTSGAIDVAVNAVISATFPHCFMGINDNGQPSICKTLGNKHCHIILRGGVDGPNYTIPFITKTETFIKNSSINCKILVDCSHGNSSKIHTNQPIVLENIIDQKLNGNESIIGVMIESNINAGSQCLHDTNNLKFGISITDSCLDFETTRNIILKAYNKL